MMPSLGDLYLIIRLVLVAFGHPSSFAIFYALKRKACAGRRERQLMPVIHRNLAHKTRDAACRFRETIDHCERESGRIAELERQMKQRAKPQGKRGPTSGSTRGPAEARKRANQTRAKIAEARKKLQQYSDSREKLIIKETDEVLNGVCDEVATFLSRQCPGKCSVSIRVIQSEVEVANSDAYQDWVRSKSRGSEWARDQMGGQPRVQVRTQEAIRAVAWTRSRCGSRSRRDDIFPWTLVDSSSILLAAADPEATKESTFSYEPETSRPRKRRYDGRIAASFQHPGAETERFKSVTVFPIRAKSYATEPDESYGFLWVDASRVFAFECFSGRNPRPDDWPPYLHFMHAVADEVATLLHLEQFARDCLKEVRSDNP